MVRNQILEKLKQARRALDSLSKVKILDDWNFDDSLNKWYLHLEISIEYKTPYFPKASHWYVVTDDNYPNGELKIYPSVENSIKVTLFHQSSNATIERNGLWRKGALCLEVNTISNFQSEPFTIDERLLYHVKRAISWLELAAQNKLVDPKEPFELPDFSMSNISKIRFIFSEDTFTFAQWENTDCEYGISELDIYKSNPSIYYVKCFKSLNNNIEHNTQWGKYLKKTNISPPIKAPWILLKSPPVINEWQAPETFEELIDVCNNQQVDFMEIIKRISSNIRDGNRHILLIGFPIPARFGCDPELIYWQALYLPALSYGKYTAKGFRSNQMGWWLRDKTEIFTHKTKIDWLISENWNQQEISQRGKMTDLVIRKNILIIGAGCLGSAVAEILVRAGVCNITIIDNDILEIGNLSRHVLNINDIGMPKELALSNYLNKLNPHANIDVINATLEIDGDFKNNINLDKYDVIIDCTGENSVLDVIRRYDYEKNHIFISISVGLGAKRLYAAFMNGRTFNFKSFGNLIFPYIESEKSLYDDYELPRNGIGCWHPTFPGRSDDVWLAASTAAKAIENYIVSNSSKTISLVYEQKVNNGLFEGYTLVAKKEDE